MTATATATAIATAVTTDAPPRPAAVRLPAAAAADLAPLPAAVAVAMEVVATDLLLVEVTPEEAGVGPPRRALDRLVLALREFEDWTTLATQAKHVNPPFVLGLRLLL
jgi:hypothetical protein